MNIVILSKFHMSLITTILCLSIAVSGCANPSKPTPDIGKSANQSPEMLPTISGQLKLEKCEVEVDGTKYQVETNDLGGGRLEYVVRQVSTNSEIVDVNIRNKAVYTAAVRQGIRQYDPWVYDFASFNLNLGRAMATLVGPFLWILDKTGDFSKATFTNNWIGATVDLTVDLCTELGKLIFEHPEAYTEHTALKLIDEAIMRNSKWTELRKEVARGRTLSFSDALELMNDGYWIEIYGPPAFAAIKQIESEAFDWGGYTEQAGKDTLSALNKQLGEFAGGGLNIKNAVEVGEMFHTPLMGYPPYKKMYENTFANIDNNRKKYAQFLQSLGLQGKQMFDLPVLGSTAISEGEAPSKTAGSGGNYHEIWATKLNGFPDDPLTAQFVSDEEGNVVVRLENNGAFGVAKFDKDGKQLWLNYQKKPDLTTEMKQLKDKMSHDRERFHKSIWVDSKGYVYTLKPTIGLTKYDALGKMVWDVEYKSDASLLTKSAAMIVDDTGNAYVAGEVLKKDSDTDILAVKYSNQGKQIWARLFNGWAKRPDWATDLAFDSSGNVIVVGCAEGSNFQSDYITLKYASDGTLKWESYFDGLVPPGHYEFALAVITDNAGNSYVTGETGRVATVKYDTGGKQSWATQAGDPAPSKRPRWEMPGRIVVDSTGNTYVAGGFSYSLEKLGGITVSKMNAQGKVIWFQDIGDEAIGKSYMPLHQISDLLLGQNGILYVLSGTGYIIEFNTKNLLGSKPVVELPFDIKRFSPRGMAVDGTGQTLMIALRSSEDRSTAIAKYSR